MVSLELIVYVVPILGLTASIFYYAMVLRNQNKTRQAQLFMQIYQEMISPEKFRIMNELTNMEWEDYDDFMRKYSSDKNPDIWSKRYSHWYRFNGIGLLVKDGLIDVDRVYELTNEMIIWQWEKFSDIIIENRRYFNNPDWMEGFEYIAEEMKKVKARRGYSTEVPETFGKYVPKEKD